MIDDEFTEEMIRKFTIAYQNQELIRNILRSLPKTWMPKVTRTQETKDLSKLHRDELLDSIKVHEQELMDEFTKK